MVPYGEPGPGRAQWLVACVGSLVVGLGYNAAAAERGI